MPFINLDQLEEKELVPGYKVKFVHSENTTTAYYHAAEGAEFPEHSHPHEQISNVIEGEFELTIDGETQVLRPGVVAVIPSNAVHSGRALKPCYIMDVFYPIREDYAKS